MNLRIFLTILTFVSLNSFAQSSLSNKVKGVNNKQRVKKLNVKDGQIITALEKVIQQDKTDSIKDNLYIIKIGQVKTSHELRIANVSKGIFSEYITGKKDPLLGFFNHRSYTIFVYGKSIPDLFYETNETVSFPFMNNTLKRKPKKNGIEYPPIIFEPNVWLFDYSNKQLIYKDVGYFNILE